LPSVRRVDPAFFFVRTNGMRLNPDEQQRIHDDFHRLVNMTPRTLAAWLETDESHKVGFRRRGETESVGHRSGRRIVRLLDLAVPELEADDYAHMKKVIGYCRRHLAQRPAGDVTDTRWRWSLMNWGHDPLKR
jgi:hypothetical protein